MAVFTSGATFGKGMLCENDAVLTRCDTYMVRRSQHAFARFLGLSNSRNSQARPAKEKL